jgi:hypothetical protein
MSKKVIATFPSRDELTGLICPPATQSHVPIAHDKAVSMVEDGLSLWGMGIESQRHELTHEGNRLFSVFNLLRESQDGDFRFAVGMRNAHDKSAAYGVCSGTSVMVCSNMQFGGTITSSRRHTTNIMDDIVGMVNGTIGQFVAGFDRRESFFNNMKKAEIGDGEANDLVIKALDAGALPASAIPKVLKEYREPRHPEFKPRTAWSLYNSFTEVFKEDRVANLPERGEALDLAFAGTQTVR